MGRVPTVNSNLPPRMRSRKQRSGKVYYYYDTGLTPRNEVPLGSDYTIAVRKWSELHIVNGGTASKLITFKEVSDRYVIEQIPKKAARTQKDNLHELTWLLKFFNTPPGPLDEIRPQHIRQYLDWRGKSSHTRANREKALFSHIWNIARSWGLTNLPNPCAGIKGFSLKRRDIYIEDAIYNAVWQSADDPLRDALDLAYLTGQRPADTLAMSITDIVDGAIAIQQEKTGKKLRIEITGELETLLAKIAERKRGYAVHTLAIICTERGQAMSKDTLRSRFDKARTRAAKDNPAIKAEIEAFQFRDLRAKAGTDKSESSGIRAAQKQLGHAKIGTTEIYLRDRIGDKTSPTK
jgi:integrase